PTCMMSSRVIEMKASNISKLNTFCQLSSIILSMTYSLYGFPNYKYLNAVWLLSAGTTITSGVGYLKRLPEWRKRIIQIPKKLLSAGTHNYSGVGYLKRLPEWRKRIIQIPKKSKSMNTFSGYITVLAGA
ncbi:hypothetical protein MN116_008863, partial [Schistosoma mekongi]